MYSYDLTMLSTVSHGEYADRTDRQMERRTDARLAVTLRFPLDAARVINDNEHTCLITLDISVVWTTCS